MSTPLNPSDFSPDHMRDWLVERRLAAITPDEMMAIVRKSVESSYRHLSDDRVRSVYASVASKS